MAGNDYENIQGWQPILLENPEGQYVRDPWLSWWEHRQRGSLGGVDCAALEGTPLYLPADEYVTFTERNAGGSGGRTANAQYNTGFKDQFMHLQSFVGSAGSRPKGSHIGYTGRSVADGYPLVPQHLHWHRIDPNGYYTDPYGSTNRRNPWSYFVGSGTSGGGTTPIDNTPKRKAMNVFLLHCNTWGDWIIVPGVSARKVGNENVTNWLSSNGESGSTGSYLPRIHVSDSDWNAFFAELAGFPVNLAGPEGSTTVNPNLR